ncbi:hypothetical protein GGD63_006310 [Bradyrhizobium sp. cir1]|uniref:hypothetical protein n=1 Tax=Bradyrhizobium sp. cir1 TaxID=1445730 RepID=UPI0016061F70|nr:hypothetical protein [Bradyrhizobium sp. cir1]MBB4373487.1 hypothetical protein [Bradyrhizobium sp. cir1]
MSKAKRLARSLEGVCGVDYGFAFKDGKRTDKLSVRFHMNRKQRLSRLPIDQRLPNTIDGIDVDVLEIGYSPHAASPRAPQRLVQPGLSVGNLKQRTTGTLGAIVRDLATQERYLLSNWHVLCGGPEASVGDIISQPGPMDLGSKSPNEVARLERWLRLSEQFDAALGRVSEGIDLSEQLFGTALVSTATVAPALGMSVVKSGAVSGVSRALVDGVSGTYRIDYTGFGDGPEWMQGFRLVPDNAAPAAALSLEGDSGSLWVERTTGRAVGLHFAGEDDVSPLNDYALAHAIDEVFMRLNVGLIAA